MSQTGASPKKPQTAYFIFSKEKRSEFKQKFPNLSSQDITKELARAFKQLPTEEKQKWEDMAIKQKEEYQKEMEKQGISPRKSKSKSEIDEDTKKSKTSPIETRSRSHEKENPHLTRSHGKAPDVSLDTAKEKALSPRKADKEKKESSVSPKAGKKRKGESMPEETTGKTEKLLQTERTGEELKNIPEMGVLEPENRNVSTEQDVESFRERERETEKKEEAQPSHQHWQTGEERVFTERRPDEESTKATTEMTEERLPTREMQEQERTTDTMPGTETANVEGKDMTEGEVQIPRRDPLHVFPEHHHAPHATTQPISNEEKMVVEGEGLQDENLNPNLRGTSDDEKSRKVKVLDTNKNKTGEVGKRNEDQMPTSTTTS